MAITEIKSNIDFELELYIRNLYHEIQSLAYSDETGDSKENKFTEYVMDKLAESGETEGVRVCSYIKENKFENIQFKINGYALEEGYENIDIFISYYNDTNEHYRVTKSDFDKLIKWSTAFVNAALKGHLDEIEPSSEAYGLARILNQNRNEIIRIRIFLISNGEITHDTPKDFHLKNMDDILIRFEVWDVERLHRLEQSKGNREPIELDFNEMLGTTIPCLEMPVKNDLYECYLAIVPGSILSFLYQNYGTRLLESNVRAFLQQTGKINQGIRDTIRFKPHMFLTYNNGLSTTAQEVRTRKSDNGHLEIVSIKDFQIVNGGQTTASLFHTSRKYKESNINDVFVQMKLTVIKDEDKKTETVPLISRFANSQNKVTELDLTSNNPFLQRLEELSRTTFSIHPDDKRKQTIWFFERVSGQYKEALNKESTKSKQDSFKLKYPKDQVLIKSEVAKVMNIWKLQPHQVSKGSQKNYVSFLKEIDKEPKHKKINRVYWEDIVANVILFRETDKLFGRKNINAIGDTNIKSHTIGYALAYFHYKTNNKLNLGAIWQTQRIDDELLAELKKLVIFTYNFFVNLDVALISEAAKSEKTWKKLLSENCSEFKLESIKKYLLDEDGFKKRYETKENSEDVKEIVKYQNLNLITELGAKFWNGLNIFLVKEQCLSDNLTNYVSNIERKLRTNLELTDNEIDKGILIIDKLTELNINFDEMKQLSKIISEEIEDAGLIYNRIKIIDNVTWEKIFALIEKSNKFNPEELFVVRYVLNRIKYNQNLDIKRLIIVAKVLDKIKKFGLNV